MSGREPPVSAAAYSKENRPRLEPRILLEDSARSHHSSRRFSERDHFDNRLIFGDNLLALNALQAEFEGKIKCIYIDPPYNTGSAFAQYDDGLEHSMWLNMMAVRLELLRRLLSADGSCWVHLDDNEAHYCKVLLDEVFGRDNFVANVVWNKSYAVRSNAEFFSTAHEHVLIYARDRSHFVPNKFRRTEKQEARYENPDQDPRGPWQSVTMTISLVGGARGRQFAKTGKSHNLYEVVSPSGKRYAPPANRCWSRSADGFRALDKEGRIWWGPHGDRAPRLKHFLSEANEGVLPTTLWADGDIFGLNQDGVRELRALGLPDFPTPKPERLIDRVLEVASNPGDWVLDSFAGSGTTGAVAHKMGRHWIMVELGEHCHTHITPRLKKVIDGADPGGVTEATGWKGGGGFRYFRLAPSLLDKDRFGNWVVSKKFNAAMLAEAMCKLEGFTYAPSDAVYWQQGRSTERDFIYTTTQTLSREQLQKLSDEVGESRSLLVCCGAFRARKLDEFPNLTVKKIPKMVLNRCEWGHDDYSLEIKNLPMQAAAPEPAVEPAAKAKAGKPPERTLFDPPAGKGGGN
ncbi:MAG: site-specific DNA-methyltransferase [Candidatus Brocadiae bacterium]|nr:site-specific DNA-methyltransferase [Candidatus Brocadiia bacterium]